MALMPSFAVSELSPGRDVGAYTLRTIAIWSDGLLLEGAPTCGSLPGS